jgi:hypothetical protein
MPVERFAHNLYLVYKFKYPAIRAQTTGQVLFIFGNETAKHSCVIIPYLVIYLQASNLTTLCGWQFIDMPRSFPN